MTVSTTTNKVSYSGTGSQTVFAYTFKIFADGDLDVYIRDTNGTETLQTITTNYTVSGAGADAGGNVTFVTAPGSTDTVVIQRKLDLTQGTDYVANDPFPAESHEDALDRLTFITQQIQEEVDRSIKASVTNTISTTEFAVSATDRANKFFAFDSAGDLVVSQEIGTFRGNWAGSTSYAQRDIVKDTSTNNIFIVNTAHTSSGAQPLTSNANSAKYDLLVDAASATTSASSASSSATAAASSATAAAASATAAAADAVSTAADVVSTNADVVTTNNNVTAAQTAQAAAEAALDTFDDRFLGAKSSDPTVDNDGNALLDGALYFDTANDLMKVYDLTNTQWRQLALTGSNQTNVNTVAGQISPTNNIATVAGAATNIGTVATDLSGSNNIGAVAGAITNVNNVGGSIANVNTVASNLTNVNAFADTYFVSGTAPSSPTIGDLWFDTSSNTMKVYGSSGFQNAGSSVNGTAQRSTFTATAGQTTFAATYDAGYVDVYLNGVKLIAGTDFTATNGTSVVLAAGAAANDTVDIVAYGTFQLSNFSINDASDVNAAGASTGQFLKWDGTNWVGGTVSTPTLTSLGLDNHDDITVDSSGNAGIGDATPDDRLSVYGGTQRLRVGNSDTNHVRIGRNSTSGNFEMTRTTSGATDQVFFKAAEANNGNVILQEGGGNVGVGTTSPETFSGYSNLEVYNSTNGGVFQFTGGGTESSPTVKGRLVADSGSGVIQVKSVSNSPMAFYTNNSERSRLSAGGMYMQGTTNSSLYATSTDTGVTLQGSGQQASGAGTAMQISCNGTEGWANIYLNRFNIGSDGRFLQFSSAGSVTGSITSNGSSTSYNTSSDHRLKENDVDMTGAIARVKQLQPKRFNFIADADTTVDGFMAHEVQTVVPEAISGTHNEVDDDGNPIYQGIDQAKLVPLLTGSLQEAIAKIETLETEMTALKTRVTELETT